MSSSSSAEEISVQEISDEYDELSEMESFSQKDMLERWTEKIKGKNLLYVKCSTFYVKRAQSDGSIPVVEDGGLDGVSNYGVGDYLLVDPRDGYTQLVVPSSEFDSLFPMSSLKVSSIDVSQAPTGDEQKIETLASEGYREYLHTEKYWVYILGMHDLDGNCATFQSSDDERCSMTEGDVLYLNWPAADGIGIVGAGEFAEIWENARNLDSPKVPQSPSLRAKVTSSLETGIQVTGTRTDELAPTLPPVPSSTIAVEASESPTSLPPPPPPPPPAAAAANSSSPPSLIQKKDQLYEAACQEFGIDKREYQAIKSRFDSYDVDSSGTLEATELANLLGKMGQEYTEDEVALILKQIDQDASGAVEFVEFLRWWTGNCPSVGASGAGGELKLIDKNKQELGSLIFLFREQYEDTNDQRTYFRFLLEVSQPKDVEFTLDCTESANMQATRGDSLVFKMKLSPYQKCLLGEMKQTDPYDGYSVGYSMSWTSFPCSEMGPMYDANLERAITDAIEAQRALENKTGLVSNLDDLTKVQTALSSEGSARLFVDLEFPPLASSVCPPSEADEMASSIVWRRASDFLDGETPQIFDSVDGSNSDAISPSDIRQGSLGDCWFMCSLASVAEFPAKIRELFVTGSYNNDGLHRVSFFKCGCWHEVTIDDFFPCFRDRGPIFSKGVGDELWVLFLEKAYAKLHGNYYALRGGFAYEGLIDLTGCPASEFSFDDEEVAKQIADGTFFAKVTDWDMHGFLMCCSTPGEDKFSEKQRPSTGGLVPGHAYTLLNISEVNINGQVSKLVRIRNPWGSFEWDGDWSDNDARWTEEVKESVAASTGLKVAEVIVEDDGTFWMPFHDFIEHFVKLSVCYLHPSGGGDWYQTYAKGILCDSATGEAAKFGAQSDSFFEFTLQARSEVVVSMSQQDTRCMGAPDMVDIAFTVLSKLNDEVVAYGWLGVEREITSAAGAKHSPLILNAGTYVIIPWSSGCRIDPVVTGATHGVTKESLSSAARQLHGRFARRKDDDRMSSTIMDGADVADLLRAAGMEGTAEDALVVAGEMERGGMSVSGLLRWLEDMYDSAGGASLVLEKLGYCWGKDASGQPALVPQDQRPFVVTLNCDTAGVQLLDIPYDKVIHEKAVEQVIKAFGELNDRSDDLGFKMYTMQGNTGASVAVESAKPPGSILEFTMDCDGSTNTVSHTGNLKKVAVIPAGDIELLHHLSPKDRTLPWGWRANFSMVSKNI